MNTRWESIVSTAREIDGAFESGRCPELSRMMQLARAVLDFQQHLVGPRVLVKTHPVESADLLDAAEWIDQNASGANAARTDLGQGGKATGRAGALTA